MLQHRQAPVLIASFGPLAHIPGCLSLSLLACSATHYHLFSRGLHGDTDNRFDNRVGCRGSAAGSHLPPPAVSMVRLQRDFLRDLRRSSGGGGRAGGRNRAKA